MTPPCSRLCHVYRRLWTIVGGLGLAALLMGCVGQPCRVAAVPTPPALLAAANGIFYLGQDGGVQVTALRASDGARLWSEQPDEQFLGASDGMVFFREQLAAGSAARPGSVAALAGHRHRLHRAGRGSGGFHG